MKSDSDEAIDFVVELGLIAEHTQGMDIKTHLGNWDKYDVESFNKARSSAPFVKVEQSWKEIDDYLLSAIAKLPKGLQTEARNAIAAIDNPVVKPMKSKIPVDKAVEWTDELFGGLLKILGVTYRCYDAADYNDYLGRYLCAHYGWALDDIGKTDLDKSHAVSASVKARAVYSNTKKSKKGTLYQDQLEFAPERGIDSRVFPAQVQVECMAYKGGKKADLTVTIVDKPAVRLPESYFCSFVTDGIKSVVAEKVGERVDLFDVVEKGNRHMHGIDGYVDIITQSHTIRIWSRDAFLINLGEANGLSYSTQYPSIDGGIHFCLNNNLWGTNFTMWNEGSLTYRFTIEVIK